MPIGQIRDFRKTKQIPRELGYTRLQITLRPDQVDDLFSGRKVVLDRFLPVGVEIKIVLASRA